ncbi:MAG: alpha/beta hydrolase [Vulcanimicrobiaceae bacterium]
MVPQANAPAPADTRIPAAWRQRDVIVGDGLALAVFTTGRSEATAPTVVLVHGMGHWTQAAWDFLAPELAATHRIIAFDLPGFGASAKPDVAYRLDFFTATLHGLVEALALDRFALVGHSLGGLIAAAYAAAYPSRVRFLGLIDPAGFLRTPKLVLKIAGSRPVTWLFGKLRPSRGFVRRTFESAVFDPAAIPPAYHERAFALAGDRAMTRAFASVYAHSMRAFVRIDALHTRLAAYTGPVLLIWGREDRFVPIAGLAAARRVYPRADVLEIPDCGHCPPLEYPALVAARLVASGA